MNGCLFFISIIYLLRWQLAESNKALLGEYFWQQLADCLKRRDYRLIGVVPSTEMEKMIHRRLAEEIKKGSLKLEDLDRLGTCYVHSHRQQSELSGLLNSYVMHLGFVLIVPLGIRLLLSDRLNFQRADLGALTLSFLGLLALWALLQRVWPRAAFARPLMLWDFVKAYLGDRDCGFWKPEFEELSQKAWTSGIDSTEERRERLQRWQAAETSKFDQRRVFLENCLGPAELFMTCFFGSVLLALPLLSHFRTLVPSV